MSAESQVLFLFKVALNLAPVAVYFLVLGLVNSHAHPRLIGARSDFLALTLVFVPILVWPVTVLATSQFWWVWVAGLLVGAGVFWKMLPDRCAGWVIYNISEFRARKVLQAALRRLGWPHTWQGRSVWLPGLGLHVDVSGFSLLKNVTLHLRPRHALTEADMRRCSELRAELETLLQEQQLLPSLTGSCLVVLGIGLMILPLWMMSRHMSAIVEVVHRLLFA